MSNLVEFTENLNKMNMTDFEGVLEKYTVKPFENPAETEYFAKYLLLGERKGLDATANVVAARISTTELFNSMPHLKVKYVDPLANALSMSKPVKAKVKVEGAIKVKSVTKKEKVKQPDFAITFRADRGGYEGWMNGKAEAFRASVEKVNAYFMKKYNKEGNLV